MLRTGAIPPESEPRNEPGIGSGARPGMNLTQLRDEVYRVLQAAVAKFEHRDETGHLTRGMQALGEAMGSARSDIYLRVMRKEDTKGNLMRAFIDVLPVLFQCPTSTRVWTEEINRLLDLEPPVPRRQAADEDVGRAWRESVRRMPEPYKTAALMEMAAQLGCRVEDIKL